MKVCNICHEEMPEDSSHCVLLGGAASGVYFCDKHCACGKPPYFIWQEACGEWQCPHCGSNSILDSCETVESDGSETTAETLGKEKKKLQKADWEYVATFVALPIKTGLADGVSRKIIMIMKTGSGKSGFKLLEFNFLLSPSNKLAPLSVHVYYQQLLPMAVAQVFILLLGNYSMYEAYMLEEKKCPYRIVIFGLAAIQKIDPAADKVTLNSWLTKLHLQHTFL